MNIIRPVFIFFIRPQSPYLGSVLLIFCMNAFLFIFAQLKTVVIHISSSRSRLINGAPANHAISASPVQSIMTFAKIAWRPDLLSVITPSKLLPCLITSTAVMCSTRRTPACSSIASATSLKRSALIAWLFDCGSGLDAPLILPFLLFRVPVHLTLPYFHDATRQLTRRQPLSSFRQNNRNVQSA